MNDEKKGKSQKLEFKLKNLNGKIRETFEIEQNIEFGSILKALRKKRDQFVEQNHQEMYVIGINYYEKREISESEYDLFKGTQFSNTKIKYVLTETLPYVLKSNFFGNTRNHIKKGQKGLIKNIESFVERRYPSKEWGEFIPLTGAVDILFNKYGIYLKR